MPCTDQSAGTLQARVGETNRSQTEWPLSQLRAQATVHGLTSTANGQGMAWICTDTLHSMHPFVIARSLAQAFLFHRIIQPTLYVMLQCDQSVPISSVFELFQQMSNCYVDIETRA